MKRRSFKWKRFFLLLPPSKNPDFYFDEKKERNSILFDFEFFQLKAKMKATKQETAARLKEAKKDAATEEAKEV